MNKNKNRDFKIIEASEKLKADEGIKVAKDKDEIEDSNIDTKQLHDEEKPSKKIEKWRDYLDFELEIGLKSEGKYPIKVIHSPAGEVDEIMEFPYSDLALENRIQALQIALLQDRGSRQALSQEERTVRDFGQSLFDSLFKGEVRSRYDVSLNEAEKKGKGLRLKLRIQPPELAALPWEFLWDSRQADYISLSKKTPLVRYLKLPQPIRPLTIQGPLRILGMVASPSDLPPLDIANEKQRVEDAIKNLRDRGLVDIKWLEGETWRDLQQEMRTGTWHVFHFIGHGGFDRNTDEGLIALKDEKDGKMYRLSATELGRLLADNDSLRLVLLNSCEGAKGGERDIFSSTAAILVRKGLPAVLAMQYKITDKAAIEFSRGFYEALADGIPVDAAISEARNSVNLGVKNSLEWGTPVLYMRSSDGVLFKIQKIPIKKPKITGTTPGSPVKTAAGTPQTFKIDIDRLVSVTWHVNGMVVKDTEKNVMTASYTRTGGAGEWNVKAVVKNAEGSDTGTWTWIVTPLPQPPRITSATPGSRVKTTAGAPLTFSIVTDRSVDVSWYVNDAMVKDTEKNVMAASYIEAGGMVGVWNVKAVVSNAEGNDTRTWAWTVKKHIEPYEEIKRNWKIILLVGVFVVLVLFILWPTPPPPLLKITTASPEPLIETDAGEAQTFGITLSQSADVIWKINDKVVKDTEKSVINASYTITNSSPGTWSVAAVVRKADGIAISQNWTWTVLPASELPPFINPIGMKFVRIPAGRFDMGSPSDEPGRFITEGPLHNVEISKDFYMSQYEVTREQWFKIMGYNTTGTTGDNLPVVMVSWNDAQRFINLLNGREKTNKYRLPSEAEWEYAARAGMIANYSFGTNSSKLGDYAWYSGNSQGTSHPVGLKKPNLWELYDIHGNVFEWVQDDWHDNYNDAPTNESAWISKNAPQKVVRGGGSWASDPLQCRLALRLHAEPANKEPDVGFRIVKDV